MFTEATTRKLARMLQRLDAPQVMVDRAFSGYYDDYKSELEDPIAQLVRDAHVYGLEEIVALAQAGEFDGTAAEASEWMRTEGRKWLEG
jgi:hypothetical protein